MREQLDTLRDQATQSGLDLHLVSKALDGPARLSTGLGFTVQEAGNRNNWMSVLFSSREDADHARAVMMEALKTAISIQLIQAENLTPHPSQFFRARPRPVCKEAAR